MLDSEEAGAKNTVVGMVDDGRRWRSVGTVPGTVI